MPSKSRLSLLLSACLLGMTLIASAQDQKSAAEPAKAEVSSDLPEAPDFEVKDLNGKTIHLRDLRGKAVLLNFWATFCVPCKTEMPWLDQFQKQYQDQGLVVLGISTFDDEAAMRKFAKAVGVDYTMAAGGFTLEDLYPANGMPYTIYIDRNGRVVDKVTGLKKREVIEDEIKRILASEATPAAK
jgi:cytochrome c biogenesis protein CcmG/thiol:disulfide interchange protein DsbE